MRIPDGWLDYAGISDPIEGVPVIAFKTPLSERYHRPDSDVSGDIPYIEKDQEFTPSQLVKSVVDKGYELLVVIDLTFTFRYYDGQRELEDEHKVQYDKVKCPGQQLPPDFVVDRVASILNDAILENGLDSKKLVGIHCTHGVNRTGYVLCRYLIEYLNYEPERAIEVVGKARGHPIEREPYLDDLKQRTPAKGFEEWKANADTEDSNSIHNENNTHNTIDNSGNDRFSSPSHHQKQQIPYSDNDRHHYRERSPIRDRSPIRPPDREDHRRNHYNQDRDRRGGNYRNHNDRESSSYRSGSSSRDFDNNANDHDRRHRDTQRHSRDDRGSRSSPYNRSRDNNHRNNYDASGERRGGRTYYDSSVKDTRNTQQNRHSDDFSTIRPYSSSSSSNSNQARW